MMRAARKRRTDKVVEEGFWEGFWYCLTGDDSQPTRAPLEYSSTSGYYAYNGVRDIAFVAGHKACREILARREELTKRQRLFAASMQAPKIPGSVYAEAYGEMRLAS